MKNKAWAAASAALAVMALTLGLATASPAQVLTTLYSFCSQSGCTDGEEPLSGPLIQVGGNFYGTTEVGGVSPYNGGTIFEITPSGTLTALYPFCSPSGCPDGGRPQAGLIQATNGNFYGTTYSYGANTEGTVFELTPSGMLTALYSFCSLSGCTDGSGPAAGLTQATNGNFYGTTFFGGNGSDCSGEGCGTVFEITPSGTLTTLYSFSGPDGQWPDAALIQGMDGNFYGTTQQGGTSGDGTVFKITPSGTLTTLASFVCTLSGGCPNGDRPYAGLIQAANGNFYGTTTDGGSNREGGTIFEITPSGTLTTLYNFCSQTHCLDGDFPSAALIQGADGNFYGTTEEGGAHNYGTVFEITPSGTLTTLYSFCSLSGCTDGKYPESVLLQAADGNFYGTTYSGGAHAEGTVFRLVIPRPCAGDGCASTE